MSYQPKVSILVPCYNVEKFLVQCLDSLINQTLKEIEIIAINDGSTDNTLKILKDYAVKDSRIIIIDKPNEGYGKSMNRGLAEARGQYIGIVESDDWAETNMFEALYNLAEKHQVQVVKSAFYNYSTQNGNQKQEFLPNSDLECIINPKQHSNIFYYTPSHWSGIYERDFLLKYNIKYLESPGASYQDIGFVFKVWLMAERVWLTPQAFLHYRKDNVSSSVHSKDKVFCICDVWDDIEEYLNAYPALKASSKQFRNYVKLRDYFWNFNRLKGENKELFRQKFIQEYPLEETKAIANKEGWSIQYKVQLMKVHYPNSWKWNTLDLLRRYISRPFVISYIKRYRKIFQLLPLKIFSPKPSLEKNHKL